jgi:hypothetical protein
MMGDGRLAHVAATREVAGADLGCSGEFADDREPGWVRERLEEPDVRVKERGFRSCHASIISINIYIDKYQYDPYRLPRAQERKERNRMELNTNIAAWMIGGGSRAADAATERNLDHVRALEASRPTSPRLVTRLAAAIAFVRPTTARVDPACCPA